MPRIPDKITDSIFYLYPTVEDARAGKNFGGTGFFVFWPQKDGDESPTPSGWLYAVTNWHVAVRDGCSVIRVNSLNGPPDIFEFGPEDWEFDPRFDIAALPFEPSRLARHKFSVILTRLFCAEWMAGNQNIGPGDDVFMVGRFIDHDGGQTNEPAARFGHISINPTPMLQGPIPSKEPCYCIDIHSRTGYSGSPVFIYRTAGNDLEDLNYPNRGRDILTSGTRLFAFLGIHFAQFPEQWEIGHIKKMTRPEENLIEGQSPRYIEGMSGMTCVLPAWTIVKVLNMPKLKAAREGREIKMTFGHLTNRLPDSPSSSVPSPESASLLASAENPTHREDFTRLLGAAARTPEPKD